VLDLLKPENTVLEELARSAPNQLEQNLRRILGGFLFSGDDVRKTVAVLSGGEKARVALANNTDAASTSCLMDEPRIISNCLAEILAMRWKPTKVRFASSPTTAL